MQIKQRKTFERDCAEHVMHAMCLLREVRPAAEMLSSYVTATLPPMGPLCQMQFKGRLRGGGGCSTWALEISSRTSLGMAGMQTRERWPGWFLPVPVIEEITSLTEGEEAGSRRGGDPPRAPRAAESEPWKSRKRWGRRSRGRSLEQGRDVKGQRMTCSRSRAVMTSC